MQIKQWDATTHLPERPKSRRLTRAKVHKDVEVLKRPPPQPQSLLVGIQNSKLLWKSLAVSYLTKHTVINKNNNCLLEFTAQRSGKLALTQLCNCWDQLYSQLPKFGKKGYALQLAIWRNTRGREWLGLCDSWSSSRTVFWPGCSWPTLKHSLFWQRVV